MPARTSYAKGTPCWIDLASPDVPASVDLYCALFGWEWHSAGPEAGGYGMFTKEGRQVAGCGPIMLPGAAPAWATYIAVDDADATAAAIAESGGTILAPVMDVMDQGRLAVFADPTGAHCSIWQPRAHTGAQLVDEPGSLLWNECYTRDAEAAADFYAAVFGWKSERVDAGGHPYTEFRLDGTTIGGLMDMRPMELPDEVPPHWLVHIGTADVDATVARLRELGGTVPMEPMDIPVGRMAVIADPVGAVLAVTSLEEWPAA